MTKRIPQARISQGPASRLLTYARRHRGRMIAATACSVMNKLCDVAPEILIGVAVDVVVRRDESFLSSLGIVDPWMQVVVLGVLTFLIWAGESLFEYLYSILWRGLAQTIQHELRLDAYGHVQTLDMAYFEDKSTGGLVAVLNDDINQLERFLDKGANELIQTATSFVAVGAVFAVLQPVIALLSLLPIPIILVGSFYFQRKAEPLYARVRDWAGRISGRLANNLSGIATIKGYTAESRELAALAADSEAYRAANSAAIRVSSAFIPLIRMAILAGFLVTLIYGGRLVLDGALEIGAYSVLIFLTQRLLWPLTRLAETLDLYQRAMASTNRVLDLLDTPAPAIDSGQPLHRPQGALTFDRVGFAYRDRPDVLTDVSVDIPAGSTAAFIGTTGSGKSTLTKLLLRFYEPSAGRILLDGAPLSALKIADLRRAVAYVSQDVFLFDGSVADNIAYGAADRAVSRDEIERAAKLAEAHDFIAALPQGYDTLVGERGQKLSGGQRQRISLARAILKDAPILILDEATSAVDVETEAAIQRSLDKIVVGRTTIIIAHRLSTIRNADQIFTLEGGRIVDRKSKTEWLAGEVGVK